MHLNNTRKFCFDGRDTSLNTLTSVLLTQQHAATWQQAAAKPPGKLPDSKSLDTPDYMTLYQAGMEHAM